MPNGATHILVGLLSGALVRDFFVKHKFPLFFVLVAAVGAILPDIDIGVFWFLNYFYDIPLSAVHRLFTHTVFLPLVLLIIGFLFYKKRKVFLTFSMLSLGSFTHLILDAMVRGTIVPFYPFSKLAVGLNLVPYNDMGNTMILAAEGLLLLSWLGYMYYKHKVKDFI